jgi:hypothetical protein
VVSTDNLVLLAPCEPNVTAPAALLQQWRYGSPNPPVTDKNRTLAVAACNATDRYQQWALPKANPPTAAPIQNVMTGLCLDSEVGPTGVKWEVRDPLGFSACNGSLQQQWSINATSKHASDGKQHLCLNVWGNIGPGESTALRELNGFEV